MSKRTVALVGMLLALVAGAWLMSGGMHGPTEARAQAPVKLNMQASWPSSLTIYDNFKMFAETVDKMSAGRLKIETLPAGAVVPAFEVLDATHRGVIDGAHTSANYWVGKHKASVLFTGGPGGGFGMDYVDYLGWMYEGGGWELYQEFYRDVLKMNVVAFPILPAGPQAFGWFKRPIKNLADLKGMKCRVTGIAAEVYREMGMTVVNMPAGDILPSAERGVIDCAEWIGGVEDLRLGFHNVWKYHYTPGMHENVFVGELLINRAVWDRLTPDIQVMVKTAANDAFFRWWARWQRQNADAIKELVDKHKVHILKTPDEILVAFLNTWDKIAEREAAKDPFFRKVLASQKQYAGLVVPAKRFMFPPYEFAADRYWPRKPSQK